MKEQRNVFFPKKVIRMLVSCLLIIGMVCNTCSYHVVLAAETQEKVPTIRLYLQKPEGWTTPVIHMWNEDAIVKGDGEQFVPAWNTSKTKLYKDASSGLYYVDVTLKGWHGFQMIDAESGKEIKVDKNVEADADVLAAFSQMKEDTSVYYLNKNGTYGWYMDANAATPLEIPADIYVNIHFYNESEWEMPCIDAWADGVNTEYSNVGAQTAIKGWDHKLPAMKAETENWYTATIQATGKLSGMQFVDAKTGTIVMLNTEQLAMVSAGTKKTPTDLYYGYGTLSLNKADIKIPKKLVKRKSPVYNADGTVTFYLATEEQKAGIKGQFNNWITTPMEAVSGAEDGFIGFTTTAKVSTEGGIYTYGMVTGEEEKWIGDPENKTKTDNPAVIRNPEIGNGTVAIYWPSTEDNLNGKVMYRLYGSKENYSEVAFQPAADAENLFAAVIDKAKAGEKYEYTIEINGKVQEDSYNFASKENGTTTFTVSKMVNEPNYISPVVKEDGMVTFYYWNPSAKEVKLAGDMTNWAADAVEMKKDTETGMFSTTISVPAGSYGYKFIVDGNWVLDEKNVKTTEGTEKSSLLEVSSKATAKPTETPVITPTAHASMTPEPTVAPTVTPVITPTVTPVITPTITPAVVPTETPVTVPTVIPTVPPTETAAPTVTPAVSPEITPIATMPVVDFPTSSPTGTVTPVPADTTTPSVTPVPTGTATPTVMPSATPTAEVVPSETPKAVYTITYVLYKGTNHKNNPNSYTTKDITLKAPVRAGYVFAGWYTDKNFTKKIKVVKAAEKRNITVYAKWNKVKKPAKVKSVKLTNRKTRKLKIIISKVQGAEGYEILYAKDKKFKKSLKKVYVSGNAKNISQLKKKQIYYVKVRAYKLDSAKKKVYGAYSSIRKIRIKK